MLSVFGLGVFTFLFGGMLWANARRWRYLAQFYAGTAGPALETRKLQSAVLIGLTGYNSLKGILTIRVHKTGVSLSVLTPFSLFHSPLFIPFGDIRGWATTWYLDAPSTELEFRQAPDIKMIVPADQAEWIRGYAGHQLTLRDVSHPDGKAGRASYAFVLVSLAIPVAMIMVLLIHFI